MGSFKLIGSGPRKVVLLSGLFGTQDSFDAMLEFADLDSFQYAAFEYGGYGRARYDEGPFTLQQAVHDVTRIVDHLGWSRFAVAGHSIGALAAQMLALALPQRVQSIVSLAGMSARGGSRDPGRQRMVAEAAFDFDKRVAMIVGGSGGWYTEAFAVAVVGASWEAIAPRAFAGLAASASVIDIHEEVKNSSLPMLVLVGDLDRTNTVELARETTLRWYSNAVLQVFAQVGHYPMLEAPVAVMRAIEAFVAG